MKCTLTKISTLLSVLMILISPLIACDAQTENTETSTPTQASTTTQTTSVTTTKQSTTLTTSETSTPSEEKAIVAIESVEYNGDALYFTIENISHLTIRYNDPIDLSIKKEDGSWEKAPLDLAHTADIKEFTPYQTITVKLPLSGWFPDPQVNELCLHFVTEMQERRENLLYFNWDEVIIPVE